MKWNEMLQNRTSGARPDKRLRTPDTLLFADELFPINCALTKNYVSRYFKINQFTPKHHFLVKSTSIFCRTFLFLFSSSDIALIYVYPVCFFFKSFRLSFPSWCMMYWSKETFMLVAQAIRSGKGVKKENGTNIIWLSSDQPDACVAKTGRQSHLWAIHHLNRFPGSPPSSCKIL